MLEKIADGLWLELSSITAIKIIKETAPRLDYVVLHWLNGKDPQSERLYSDTEPRELAEQLAARVRAARGEKPC